MMFNKLHFIVFLTMLAQVVVHPLFGQNSDNYRYLIACFKNSTVDSSRREIKGIGDIETISLESVELEETGLTYYEIPLRKKNKPASKLTQLVADQYIQTWKNNSRVELYEEFAIGKSSIVDLRLHILIEDIYVQIVFICDGENIYEIMCFRNLDDKPHFNAISKKNKRQVLFIAVSLFTFSSILLTLNFVKHPMIRFSSFDGDKTSKH